MSVCEDTREVAIAVGDDNQATPAGQEPPMNRTTDSVMFDNGEDLEDDGVTTLRYELPSTANFVDGIDLVMHLPTIANFIEQHRPDQPDRFVIPDHVLKHHFEGVVRESDRSLADAGAEGKVAYFHPLAAYELIKEVRLVRSKDPAGTKDKSPRKKRTKVIARLSGADIESMNLTQRHAPATCTLRASKELALCSDDGHKVVVSLPLFPVPFPQRMFGAGTTFTLEVDFNDWRGAVANLLEDDRDSPRFTHTVVPAMGEIEHSIGLVTRRVNGPLEFDYVGGMDFRPTLCIHRSDFARARDLKAFNRAHRGQRGVGCWVLTGMEPKLDDVSATIQGAQIELDSVGGPIRKLWLLVTAGEEPAPKIAECGVAIENQPYLVKEGSECALQRPFSYEIDFGDERINGLHAKRLPEGMKASLVVTTEQKQAYRLVCGGLVWKRVSLA